MSGGLHLPVIAGLGIGVAFVILFAVLMSPTNEGPKIKLREEWDKKGQLEAVEVLLTDPEVRVFVNGRNFEVFRYSANFTRSGFEPDVCEVNGCTLIGIQERKPDGSTDCAFQTFVNIYSKRVDRIFYEGSCNAD